MEILTIQNYFLGHMEAYQDSQTSLSQLNSISPLLSLKKKKKFQLLLTVYYIAQ